MPILHEESFGIIPLKRTLEGWSIFVVQHKNGEHWGFPKGKADLGETPLECAQRELSEETGLKVEELLQDEPIFEKYTFLRAGKEVHKKVFYFLALVAGSPELQPSEIHAGKWFLLNEAQEKLTYLESKKICERVKQILEIL